MMTLNTLLDKVEPSKSVTLLAKTRKLQETDPTILNFTGGEPDFDTPKAICDEAYRQMLAGQTHYANAKGDIDLRRALAEKLARENGAPYGEDDILVTTGGKYAIYVAVQAMMNPGDEALWLTPGWVSYPAIVTLCGGTAKAVHLDYDQDYALTADLLEAQTTDKTKLLIINYPNNPTGKLMSEQDMAELKTWMRRHPQVYVISDEIYEKLVYDGKSFTSLASDPEFFGRTLIVNGFSKCSAMTGWRIGYLACPPELMPSVMKIFQHSMSCVATFTQKAAIVALHCEEETEQMRLAYERRRMILYNGIKEIPKAELVKPEGSFYAWVRFDTALDSETVCNRLLEEAGVAGIPGSAYGEEKYPMVRFCYASEDDKLKELVRRLKIFCESL